MSNDVDTPGWVPAAAGRPLSDHPPPTSATTSAPGRPASLVRAGDPPGRVAGLARSRAGPRRGWWGRRPEILGVLGLEARRGSGRPREIRLALGRHRRLVGAVVLVVACWITVRWAAPPRPATVGVTVAARDLPAGARLTSRDERRSTWLADSKPQGALDDVTGQVLGAPIRAGEAFTGARVLGRGLLVGQPAGTVAFPVRLDDADTVLLVAAGDRVDVLAPADGAAAMTGLDDGTSITGDQIAGGGAAGTVSSKENTGSGTGRPTRVVTGVTVLAVGRSPESQAGEGDSGGTLGGLGGLTGSGGGSSDTGTGAGGLLVLAITPGQAAELASAQAAGYLTIAILPRSAE
jgi:Flp pilus assembly protein CpaB